MDGCTRGGLGQLWASLTIHHLEAWFLRLLRDRGNRRGKKILCALVGGMHTPSWRVCQLGEGTCGVGMMCAYMYKCTCMVLSPLPSGSPCTLSVALSPHPQQTHYHLSLSDGAARSLGLCKISCHSGPQFPICNSKEAEPESTKCP